MCLKQQPWSDGGIQDHKKSPSENSFFIYVKIENDAGISILFKIFIIIL